MRTVFFVSIVCYVFLVSGAAFAQNQSKERVIAMLEYPPPVIVRDIGLGFVIIGGIGSVVSIGLWVAVEMERARFRDNVAKIQNSNEAAALVESYDRGRALTIYAQGLSYPSFTVLAIGTVMLVVGTVKTNELHVQSSASTGATSIIIFQSD